MVWYDVLILNRKYPKLGAHSHVKIDYYIFFMTDGLSRRSALRKPTLFGEANDIHNKDSTYLFFLWCRKRRHYKLVCLCTASLLVLNILGIIFYNLLYTFRIIAVHTYEDLYFTTSKKIIHENKYQKGTLQWTHSTDPHPPPKLPQRKEPSLDHILSGHNLLSMFRITS